MLLLLSLSLFPFTIGYIGHDFHALFNLFILFIFPLLTEVLNFLLIDLFLLLDEALLKPIFESSLAFFILMLFLKPFVLLLSEFFLSLESFSDQFSFFPFIHALSSLLILLIEYCLLLDKFLIDVFLSFMDQNFS